MHMTTKVALYRLDLPVSVMSPAVTSRQPRKWQFVPLVATARSPTHHSTDTRLPRVPRSCKLPRILRLLAEGHPRHMPSVTLRLVHRTRPNIYLARTAPHIPMSPLSKRLYSGMNPLQMSISPRNLPLRCPRKKVVMDTFIDTLTVQ